MSTSFRDYNLNIWSHWHLCQVRHEGEWRPRALRGTREGPRAQRLWYSRRRGRAFEWVNPHSWLRVMVNDEKTGKPVLWTLELGSPSQLITMGMHANSLKPGDVVSVSFHPIKGRFAHRPRSPRRGGALIPTCSPLGTALAPAASLAFNARRRRLPDAHGARQHGARDFRR
jgi:hypothetical protein